MQATLFSDVRHALAEGPVWHEGALWWVNITEGRLYRWVSHAQSAEHYDIGSTLGVALPALDGWWWAARERDCAWFHHPTGQVIPIDAPIANLPPVHRFNDGFCAPDGHPWVGSAALDDSKNTASLYRADTAGALHVTLPGITLSNGLGWSPDGATFYYVDSLARNLSVFDYASDSHQITNRRILREFHPDEGLPDGLTIDAEGQIWLALWGGSAVIHLDSQSGEILHRIDFPVSQVTSCTFGGEAGNTLYITSARNGLDEAALEIEPLAGSIFQVQTHTTGLPPVLCSLPHPTLP